MMLALLGLLDLSSGISMLFLSADILAWNIALAFITYHFFKWYAFKKDFLSMVDLGAAVWMVVALLFNAAAFITFFFGGYLIYKGYLSIKAM